MAEILSQKTPFDKLFQRAGEQYGVDPRVLKSMAFVESSFNPEAVGPKTKYGRAQGLMQFMPATARAYKLRNPFDPNQAVPAAARYMKDLITQFDGDLSKALEAYNGGPRLVGRSSQTKQYAQKVMAAAGLTPAVQQEAPAAPEPIIAAQATPQQGPRTMDQGDGANAVLESAQLALSQLPNYAAALNLFMDQGSGDTEEEYNQYAEAFGPEMASVISDYEPVAMARGGYVDKLDRGGVPSQSEVPQLDESGRVITTPVVPGPPEKDFSTLDYLLGAADVGSTILKSTVVEPYALARGLYEQAKSGEAPTSRRVAEKKAEEIRQAARVAPRTEAGGQMLQSIAKMAQDAKIPSIVPQLMGLPVLQRGAVGQGAVLATEEAVLPVMRSITGNKDLTPGQIYSAMGDTGATLRAGAPAAIKARAGDVAGDASVSTVVRQFGEINSQYRDREYYKNLTLDDVEGYAKSKVKNYFNRLAGSPDDPLYKAFIDGEYDLPRLDETLKQKVTALRSLAKKGEKTESGKDPKTELRRLYDERIGSDQPGEFDQNAVVATVNDPAQRQKYVDMMIEEGMVDSPQEADAMIQIALNNQNTSMFRDLADFTKDILAQKIADEVKTQGGVPNLRAIKSSLMYRHNRADRLKDDLDYYAGAGLEEDSFIKSKRAAYEALKRGKVAYTFDPTVTIDLPEVFGYMERTPKEKWQNLEFPELVLRAQKDYKAITDPLIIAERAEAGKPLTFDQATLGTKPYISADSDRMPKATWREITSEEGLRIEGCMNGICLRREHLPTYARRLENGESRFFTLRDKKGNAKVTVEMTRFGFEGPHTVVKQIKGYSNESPIPKYSEEIRNFLNEYASKQERSLSYIEEASHIPAGMARTYIQRAKDDNWTINGYRTRLEHFMQRIAPELERRDLDLETEISDANNLMDMLRKVDTRDDRAMSALFDEHVNTVGEALGYTKDQVREMSRPLQGFAKGGMVDKPLYDRA